MAADEHAPDHDNARLPPMRYRLPLLLVLALAASGHARADDLMNIDVSISGHRFTPAEIHVPAGKPVTLTIKNEDATVEEFDSLALKVEKVIVGGRTATLRLRPLGAGRYPFMGEYHSDTAQGVVIAQ
jgi:plastocyanin